MASAGNKVEDIKQDTTKQGKQEHTHEEEIISKTSINKYDPFQLKSSIDDEIVAVSIIAFCFINQQQ